MYNLLLVLLLLIIVRAQEEKVWADLFLAQHTRRLPVTPQWQRPYGTWEWDGGGALSFNAAEYISKQTHHLCSPRSPLAPSALGNDEFYEHLWTHTLERHILLAKASGITGFLVEWAHARDADTNTMMIELATRAAQHNMEIGVNWVGVGFLAWQTFSPSTRAQARLQMQQDVLWLMENVYDVAGAKMDGKNVVALFDYSEQTASSVGDLWHDTADVAAMRLYLAARNYDVHFLARRIDAPSSHPLDGFFAWLSMPMGPNAEFPYTSVHGTPESLRANLETFETRVKSQPQHVGISTIARGFDDHRGKAWGSGNQRMIPVRHNGKSTLSETLAAYAESPLRHHLVVTWNDIEEGTFFEPSREALYGDLDAVAQAIALRRGETAAPPFFRRAPFRVYRARERLALLQRLQSPQVSAVQDAIDAASAAVASLGSVQSARAAVEAMDAALSAAFADTIAHRRSYSWQVDASGATLSNGLVLSSPPGQIVQRGKPGMMVTSAAGKLALGWRVDASLRGELQEAGVVFDARVTVEFWDAASAESSNVEILADASDARLRTMARIRRHNGPEQIWRRIQVDFFNARYVGGLSPSSDLLVVDLGASATVVVHAVRIEGELLRRRPAQLAAAVSVPLDSVRGTARWIAATFGADSATAMDICAWSGGVTVIGEFANTVASAAAAPLGLSTFALLSGDGLKNAFLVTYSAESGQLLWARRIGGTYNAQLTSCIVVDQSLHVYGYAFGDVQVQRDNNVENTQTISLAEELPFYAAYDASGELELASVLTAPLSPQVVDMFDTQATASGTVALSVHRTVGTHNVALASSGANYTHVQLSADAYEDGAVLVCEAATHALKWLWTSSLPALTTGGCVAATVLGGASDDVMAVCTVLGNSQWLLSTLGYESVPAASAPESLGFFVVRLSPPSSEIGETSTTRLEATSEPDGSSSTHVGDASSYESSSVPSTGTPNPSETSQSKALTTTTTVFSGTTMSVTGDEMEETTQSVDTEVETSAAFVFGFENPVFAGLVGGVVFLCIGCTVCLVCILMSRKRSRHIRNRRSSGGFSMVSGFSNAPPSSRHRVSRRSTRSQRSNTRSSTYSQVFSN